ncbi:MAG: biotin/lipoyl-binding protein [Spirochaetales bacterium]|jgi:pyruvate carboxylase subunit B|nr:biotin/lipoyl-binding protein [Spirochaetales bacterium]
MKKKVHFMCTAFRDGFQSVYGARAFSKDFLPAVKAAAEAGIAHFEAGGGAMFQSPIFYANEDAFRMMDDFRAAAGPEANLQTLARGVNVVGLDSQPRDMIKLHAQLFKKHGITTIRNFDALNDVNNLIYSGQCIHDAGLKHEVVVTMMELPPGTPGSEKAHTPEFYTNVLKSILEAGIPYDSVCFKDASGTSAPRKVFLTIQAARKLLGDKTHLVFHSHETADVGISQYMLALEAGADQVDLSLSPVSGGTCQPDVLSMWHALRGTDFDLNIDVTRIMELEQFFKECMKDYFLPPEATQVEPLIPMFPMPGGALTTNTQMLRDNGLMNRYPEVIAAMGEAVQKGGFGTSVTPVSQFYFQQAFNNVMFGKWKKIAPGYGKMVLGYFGKTPVDPDPEVVRIAQEQIGLEPTKEIAVDINDRDPKKGYAAAKKLLEAGNLPITDENIFIAAACQEKGIQFLEGKATIGVRKEAAKKKEAGAASSGGMYTVTVNSVPYVVNLQGSSAVVNGVSYAVNVTEGAAAGAVSPAPAAGGGSVNVAAPLPGLILRIGSKIGDVVKEGDTILVLESMKMETPIKAPASGTITAISVTQGAQVQTGQTLAVIGGASGGGVQAAPQPAAPQAAPAPVAGGGVNIEAPLPGLILRIVASPGASLKSGDTILVLESMKMETPIKAPQAGVLKQIAVAQGAQVQTGQVLAVLG